MKDFNLEKLLEDLKKDGAFDCEHSCESVQQYFKGHIDGIDSIKANLMQIVGLIDEATGRFQEVISYAKKNQSNKCNGSH